jgi:nicotinate-nucleotide adenylyltransferase
MHVGIFGGTFDPPHLGHLIVAEWMRDAFDLDLVLWMPASRSPHKQERSPASDGLRMEMVRAATADNASFAVSDLEIRRGGLSYTVDTLEELHASRPQDRFSLIMGSDTLAGFERWHRPERIAELAEFLVFARRGNLTPTTPTLLEGRVRTAIAPLMEISATDIRERCAVGRSIRYLVPASVETVIEAHGLYR